MSYLRGFVLAVATLLLGAGNAAGAPITLRVEAEVTHLVSGNPFETGLNVAVGDLVQGTLIFEPDSGNGGDFLGVTQPNASASFEVGGKHFGMTPADEGINFQIFNDAVVLDGVGGILDTVRFGGAFSSLPEEITSGGWTIDLAVLSTALGSDPSIFFGAFETAEIPAEVDAWNLLASTPQSVFGQQLYFSFGNSGDGAVGIGARIECFTLIPEPAGRELLIVGVVVALCCWRLRQHSEMERSSLGCSEICGTVRAVEIPDSKLSKTARCSRSILFGLTRQRLVATTIHNLMTTMLQMSKSHGKL